MVQPLRHRRTKGAATDMFYLMPPRHISTLPIASLWGRPVLAQSYHSLVRCSIGFDLSNPGLESGLIYSGPQADLRLSLLHNLKAIGFKIHEDRLGDMRTMLRRGPFIVYVWT